MQLLLTLKICGYAAGRAAQFERRADHTCFASQDSDKRGCATACCLRFARRAPCPAAARLRTISVANKARGAWARITRPMHACTEAAPPGSVDSTARSAAAACTCDAETMTNLALACNGQMPLDFTLRSIASFAEACRYFQALPQLHTLPAYLSHFWEESILIEVRFLQLWKLQPQAQSNWYRLEGKSPHFFTLRLHRARLCIVAMPRAFYQHGEYKGLHAGG
jgi:hypothetical protein